MNLSMKWLRDFVDIDMPPREFSEAMTMSGSKVENYFEEGKPIDKVVVGKVLAIERHPDADKLVVCRVDVAHESPIVIVTAATNLKENDIVPVALDGSTLFDGTKIKKGKLRGVESQGMFCSLTELGLSINDFPYAIEDGIFVLQEDCYLGQDIKEAIGLNDIKIEFEITPNRPDCFSVIGLAREAAVTFNKSFEIKDPIVQAGHGKTSSLISVEVKEKDLCKHYSARVVKNVKVCKSPRWIRERLRAMGVRPINNIVDITNYVMLEYGQPMHAFDINSIDNNKIVVRCAHKDEEITTLDGVNRKLSEKNLVIADQNKVLAIAGVMGAEFSGITDQTKTIVLESALFDAKSVRLTARDHGLRTESSSRFEKGLDVNNCVKAINRACELIELLGIGDVMDDSVTCDHSDIKTVKILFEHNWINQFLDTNISKEQMQNILEALGYQFEGENIIVPSYRPDVENRADIAEEIARFYGYNNIESKPMQSASEGGYSKNQIFEKDLNSLMRSFGLNEISTYSFINSKDYDKITLDENDTRRNSVRIVNPLGESTSLMRTTVLPSMLDVISRNYNNRNKNIKFFEIAKEYTPADKNRLPEEHKKLIVGMCGDKTDFFNIKGIIDGVLEYFSIHDFDIKALEDDLFYHKGRCAIVSVGERELARLGEVHPTVTENYEIDQRVYIIDLSLDVLFENKKTERLYDQLPKFPSVERDLCLVCDANIPVLDLQKVIKTSANKTLESIEIFDVYTGDQIEKGKKSVAFKITLRSKQATLTDEQVTAVVNKLIKALEKLGVQLRS